MEEPAPSRRAAEAPGAGVFGVTVRATANELVLRHADFPELVSRVPGFESCTTLAELFDASTARHATRPMLGTRPVLAIHAGKSGRGGGHTERREVGPYAWMSCESAAMQAATFGAGLRALGIQPRSVVALFADTSAYWFLAAHACFREGFTVATVYTSLGAAAVRHALEACGAASIITDAAGARLIATTDVATKAARIVLLPPRGNDTDADAVAADAAAARSALPADTLSHTWREVTEAAARAEEAQRRKPEPADIALVMFTSGSTGTPKGVLISHSAIVAAIAGMLTWNTHAAATLQPIHGADAHVAAAAGPHDRVLAYLPMSHIFEFVMENAVALVAGAGLGYGTPQTLTDASPGVAPGSRGDAPALHPTFLTAVPTVLERVRASVDGGLRALRGARGAVARPAFSLAFALGEAALRHCGVYGAGAIVAAGPAARSRACALVSRAAVSMCGAVFAAPRAALGSSVRFFLSGGAPLSPSTQRYLQVVFGCPVLQGYGLTETCCIGTLTSPADLALGRCGAPVPSGWIKLVPWPEGGYSPADQPLPRGEVHIGGPALANGYHSAEEATDADFYTDGDGMRWFRTGDIGVVHPDGCLSIVDRRKDIVKLERGEFLSLGKVEAALQAEGTLVAHALVLAKGTMKAPAVLVAPRMHALRERLGVPGDGDDDDVLRTPAATKLVLDDLREAGRRAGLECWEVPTAVRLVAGPWTPESGLVTAALKVRRQSVQAAFKEDVDALLSRP